MNRARRGPITKPFVAGGIYDPSLTSQQQQQQQSQEQQQQQQQLQQQSVPQKPRPLHHATGAQQQQLRPVPLPIPQPVIKQEPETIPSIPISNSDEGSLVENGKPLFKKIFLSRKKASVRAKEKRIRQNRQLRKAILPKNALMALNEVKGITISDYSISGNKGGGFTALVTVNSTPYEGVGNSKIAAKNKACEKALRDYVIAKMIQKPRHVKRKTSISDGGVEAMDTTENMETENGSVGEKDDADDVPMVNLASFALFKLFSEWESEGFVIPEMHVPTGTSGTASASENGEAVPKEPKKPPIRSELPANWQEMHPATLLCVMRPGLNYTYYGPIGEKPNVLQQLGVFVDDREYIATGRSKKVARRNVAVIVCNELFGTNFTEEIAEAAQAPSVLEVEAEA